jgi:SAM-dependent methyltransferase
MSKEGDNAFQIQSALTDVDYDVQWRELSDFIKYNPGAVHRRRIICQLVSEINHPIKSYLDVGCGPGELILALQKRLPAKCSFTGADLSLEVIRTNEDRMPDFAFHKLDITRETIDRQFDLVTCSEVIEHINVKDRQRVLEHLASMLNPGGTLILTCPTRRIFPTEIRYGHVNHPKPQEIVELAKGANFSVVTFTQWGFPFYWYLKKAVNFNTDWSIKEFGTGRYSLVKKAICQVIYWVNFLNWNSSRGCQLFFALKKN